MGNFEDKKLFSNTRGENRRFLDMILGGFLVNKKYFFLFSLNSEFATRALTLALGLQGPQPADSTCRKSTPGATTFHLKDLKPSSYLLSDYGPEAFFRLLSFDFGPVFQLQTRYHSFSVFLLES